MAGCASPNRSLMNTSSLKQKLRVYIPSLWILSAARINLNLTLQKVFARVPPGLTLDVGAKDSPYRKWVPHTEFRSMDIADKGSPDQVGDVQNMQFGDNEFDTVICTQVLEHVRNPQAAVDEVRRILKSGGVCVLSAPFIYPYHADPNDYYRFSEEALDDIFEEYSEVEIIPHGNRFQVLWLFISMGMLEPLLNIFNPVVARLGRASKKFPLGYVVWARK